MLALYLRKNLVSFEQALQIQAEAELVMADNEFEVNSADIITLVKESDCSAYDCEYVALAQSLNTKLVTMDRKTIAAFPDIARSLSKIVSAF